MAGKRQVEGEHQCRALHRRGPVEEVVDELPVAHDVKLKPEGLLDIVREILQAADRDGG